MDAIRLGRNIILSIALLLAISGRAQAALLFVVPSLAPQVMQMVNQTQQLLKEDVDVRLLKDVESSVVVKHYQAVVLVGAQVLQEWQPLDIPTVAVFISREQYEDSTLPLNSAVYAEPSLHQQILLAEAILGKDKTIGLLARNNTQLERLGIDSFEQDYHHLVVETMHNNQGLNSALQALLKHSDAIVGVYDKEIYSTDNIKNILITAYRKNQPLIGPTYAYLRAGAVASVHSGPNEVALRLSEVLERGLANQGWPKANYNPHIKVVINQQVARSLNLSLESAEALAQKVQYEQDGYFKDRDIEL